MAKKIVMPKLGLTMKEGKLGKWYKNENDEVKAGDKLFSIETDKITNDAEATDNGFLRKIIVQAGSIVPIMEPVAILAGKDEDIEEILAELNAAPEPVSNNQQHSKTEVKPEKVEGASGRVKISPAARKLAAENGIDIESIVGTGPGGRLVIEDIEDAIKRKKDIRTSPAAGKKAQSLGVDISNISKDGRVMKEDVERAYEMGRLSEYAKQEDNKQPLTRMRQIISERMSKSSREIPSVNFTISVDMSAVKNLKDELKPDFPATYTDIVTAIAARLLLRHPYLNSTLEEDGIILRNYVNMGVAVALEDGLLVPVIRNAHLKSIRQISEDIKDLSYRARVNTLTADEIQGGTFTITNIGMYGIEAFTPIINQPESAILGMNAIVETPVVLDGCIQVKPIIKLSLTADHRTVDGAVAAQFLAKLKEYLEHPLRILV
jgi:pyruvate dehydrogenase E2 component (dihydrolipoamide acetyltransferase)